jgi:hypothetical protein
MIELDGTTEPLLNKEFWYLEIRMIMEDQVLNHVSVIPSMTLGSLHNSFGGGFGEDDEILEPDFIRSNMNDWLMGIIQDENVDASMLPQQSQGRRGKRKQEFSNNRAGQSSEL